MSLRGSQSESTICSSLISVVNRTVKGSTNYVGYQSQPRGSWVQISVMSDSSWAPQATNWLSCQGGRVTWGEPHRNHVSVPALGGWRSEVQADWGVKSVALHMRQGSLTRHGKSCVERCAGQRRRFRDWSSTTRVGVVTKFLRWYLTFDMPD